MCWNAEISLNTFLFGSASLVFVIYNNYYTKYKIPWFRNVWLYVWAALVILIQLVEYFLWRNMSDPHYNYLFSFIGMTVLFLQPVASILSISFLQIRYSLLSVYLLLSIPFIMNIIQSNGVNTKLMDDGHLKWNFKGNSKIADFGWVFFAFIGLVIERRWWIFAIGMITLAFSYYNYRKFRTVGSLWCWTSNSGFLFLLAYILIYLPFKEHCKLC